MLGILFGICFGIYSFDDVSICTPMYGYKYYNELCYKAPLCDMRVMLICYHDVVMLYELELSRMIIVTIIMSGVINLHCAICCHVVMMFFLLSGSFIVNITLSCVIKLHE